MPKRTGGFGAAAARATGATIASRNGRASVPPSPLSIVRRSICHLGLVMVSSPRCLLLSGLLVRGLLFGLLLFESQFVRAGSSLVQEGVAEDDLFDQHVAAVILGF